MMRVMCWRTVFLLIILFLANGFVAVMAADSADQTCAAGDATCHSASATFSVGQVNDNNNNNKAAAAVDKDCQDELPEADCFLWAVQGECENNPNYMLNKCKKSCGACGADKNANNSNNNKPQKAKATTTATAKESQDPPASLQHGWGEEQDVDGSPLQREATQLVIDRTTDYMVNQVFVDDIKFGSVRDKCKNRHTLCSFWASIGECENNPLFMVAQCAPACRTCEKIDFSARCPLDVEAAALENVWTTNLGLDQMFERITTDPYYQQYSPVVLKNPKDNGGAAPWIITLENFLTEEECNGLIKMAKLQGYGLSSDVGKPKFDGSYEHQVNKARGEAIKVAWCVDDCYRHPITEWVTTKLVNVTGIPEANLEYLQVARHNASTYVDEAQDYAAYHLERAQGVRILSAMMFLSDLEEGATGGGIMFPSIDNLTIAPKRGRAVLWPNVLHASPNAQDVRTIYRSVPLTLGFTYSAAAWFHMRDFKTPFAAGCS